MSTPITDAAWEMEENETWSATACEMKEVARRLETDRAALMLVGAAAAGALDAAAAMLDSEKLPMSAASIRAQGKAMMEAIVNAHANFPQP